MSRLGFVGEHPMLQFRRDLDLVAHLDAMFLAAAGERTKRIKLATGVVFLPIAAAAASMPDLNQAPDGVSSR
jgi:alkanesulfonate monooxygenase SsuD/methylene tetrahydromethanopterin reductase-like flavin-dependent oxidoreductase (luciferase family)